MLKGGSRQIFMWIPKVLETMMQAMEEVTTKECEDNELNAIRVRDNWPGIHVKTSERSLAAVYFMQKHKSITIEEKSIFKIYTKLIGGKGKLNFWKCMWVCKFATHKSSALPLNMYIYDMWHTIKPVHMIKVVFSNVTKFRWVVKSMVYYTDYACRHFCMRQWKINFHALFHMLKTDEWKRNEHYEILLIIIIYGIVINL